MTVTLETTAFARGRVLVDETLTRVRVGDGQWRKPRRGWTLEKALTWLMEAGYEPVLVVRPKGSGHTVTMRFFSR